QPQVLEAFTARMSTAGMPRTAIMPAYGMAEATLAITMAPPRAALTVLTVDATHLRTTGTVRAPVDPASAVAFVSCGNTFHGHRLRVVNAQGQELPEDHEGEIQFQGPSV